MRASLKPGALSARVAGPAAISTGLGAVLLAVEARGRLAFACDADVALTIGGPQAALAVGAWTARWSAAIDVFLIAVVQAVVARGSFAFAAHAFTGPAIIVVITRNARGARNARTSAGLFDAWLNGNAPVIVADHPCSFADVTHTIKTFDTLSFMADTSSRCRA
jgi:hypothetical protein